MSASEAQQQANRAGMDPKRLVVIAYLVFGIVIALFLGDVFERILAQLGIASGALISGLDWASTGAVAGVVVTLAIGAYCAMNPKISSLALDVATELMRVTWPSFEETRVSTVAVVVASLIAAIVLFGIDSLSYKAMIDWLPTVWGNL